MKRILFLALAAFALFSCNKEMAIVENESQSQPLKYVFNIAEKPSFDANTRAVKTSWEEGDKIYINFDDATPTSLTDFTVLKYDGSAWVVDNEGNGPGDKTSGTLDALYYANPSPTLADFGDGGKAFSNSVADFGKYMFLNKNNIDYTVDDGEVKASISLDFEKNIDRTYVQFCITELGEDDDWWFVTEDRSHPEENGISAWVPEWQVVDDEGRFSYLSSTGFSRSNYSLNKRTDGHYFYSSIVQNADKITITLVKGTGDTQMEYSKTFSKNISGKCAAITFKGPQLDENGEPTNGWTKKTGKINGHEYVNMGNGLKWATMNLGASKPEDFGDYYAWGETATKDTYTIMNYVLADIPENAAYPENTGWIYINKYTFDDKAERILGDPAVWYNASGEFIGDNKSTFADYNYEDDAARTLWESTWRTPTEEEYQWLLDDNNCSSEFVEDYHESGEGGMLFTSKVNGNELFFPLAGSFGDKFYEGYGHYWTATRSSNESDFALVFGFQNNGKWSLSDGDRFLGFTIRPVSD